LHFFSQLQSDDPMPFSSVMVRGWLRVFIALGDHNPLVKTQLTPLIAESLQLEGFKPVKSVSEFIQEIGRYVEDVRKDDFQKSKLDKLEEKYAIYITTIKDCLMSGKSLESTENPFDLLKVILKK
jgi:hypothetical protein